jgi:TBC domain-containing protein kinase-like protein
VNLEPKNIFLTNRDLSCGISHESGLKAINGSLDLKVKLYDYGLGHMTNYGEFVAFPVFVNPAFTPPEIFLENPAVGGLGGLFSEQRSDLGEISPQDDQNNCDSIVYIEPCPPPRYSSNCAVWSLGMILACQFLGIERPWPNLKASQTIRKVLSMSKFKGNVLERLAREHTSEEKLTNMSASLREFIDMCLVTDPKIRLHPADLWSQSFGAFNRDKRLAKSSFPTLNLRCQYLELPPIKINNTHGYEEKWTVTQASIDDENTRRKDDTEESALDVINIHEIYYLWQLAGGDTLGELRKCGLIINRPAVLSLFSIVLNEGHVQGQIKERSSLYDPSIISLNLSQLASCLDSLSSDDLYPTCEEQLSNAFQIKSDVASKISGIKEGSNMFSKLIESVVEETASLPLVIKERDVRYQFKRTVLYRRLLQGYPYTRPNIWKEARIDSLPLYRSYIWAALLGINNDVLKTYEAIDKETWTTTDRQIEVDIPRCHQYNYLLASPEGHRKFKRVLKAWVVTNQQYVYWQGLDSLTAPFLLLNFNDEALAYACLSAFIPKYLYGMFRKDNANVIQEYLAKFCHLQAFHDPALFNHLDGIGFIPELYAIPWVLTMFAHVFPLHNIFHLWDKLLLGNSSFPLCVALAILYQLRDRLLHAEFNDCILLFSDLPAIDIERCVKDSIQIFCSTPRSLTFRKYGSPSTDNERKNGKEKLYFDKSRKVMQQDLTMESISLEEQKKEKVPRISGEEALILLGIAKTRITTRGDLVSN